jgi:hypothetical protein
MFATPLVSAFDATNLVPTSSKDMTTTHTCTVCGYVSEVLVGYPAGDFCSDECAGIVPPDAEAINFPGAEGDLPGDFDDSDEPPMAGRPSPGHRFTGYGHEQASIYGDPS